MHVSTPTPVGDADHTIARWPFWRSSSKVCSRSRKRSLHFRFLWPASSRSRCASGESLSDHGPPLITWSRTGFPYSFVKPSHSQTRNPSDPSVRFRLVQCFFEDGDVDGQTLVLAVVDAVQHVVTCLRIQHQDFWILANGSRSISTVEAQSSRPRSRRA